MRNSNKYVTPEYLNQLNSPSKSPIKPLSMHRRTPSKASEELLHSLKHPNPETNKKLLITPELIISQMAKKGLSPSKQNYPISSDDSDDESIIRKIISQRKVLTPLTCTQCPSPVPQETEKNTLNTNTTALTYSEETNFEKVIQVLGQVFFPTDSSKKILKNIGNLMQKCSEPIFALALDPKLSLKGVYYLESSTGFFHRILAQDECPIVIPPRRVQEFLVYNQVEKAFAKSTISRFEALVYI